MTSAYSFEPDYEDDVEVDTIFENNGLNINYKNRSGTCNWCKCETKSLYVVKNMII